VEHQQIFCIECADAFHPSTLIYSNDNELTDVLILGQPVIMETCLEPSSRLYIQAVRWNLHPLLRDESQSSSEIVPMQRNANSGEKLPLKCTFMVPCTAPENELAVGDLIIEWRRDESCELVRTIINLGQLPIITAPLSVSAKVQHRSDKSGDNDDELTVRKPFAVEFTIRSTWPKVLPLQIELERSDLFVFSGYKEYSLRLLPKGVHTIQMAITAISMGFLPFPKLNISCADATFGDDVEEMNQLIQNYSFRSLPRTVYVLP